MRKTNLPNIGSKIELETIGNVSMMIDKKLVSQIMDVLDEQFMFIATPIYQNVMTPLPVNEMIKIRYVIKDLGVYEFEAKVVGRKKVDDISYMKIERIGEIIKVQRRDFFRLEALINAEIKIVQKEIENEKTICVLTKDISGGGLRLISKEALKAGSIVEIKIETGEKPIFVQGKILRCVPYEESYYNFEIGVIYKDIEERVRDEIISFIFEYQRKMRKKGLV